MTVSLICSFRFEDSYLMFSVHLTLASGILLECFDWVLGTPPEAGVARV